ncbi:MAG: hypothetical protein JNJ61_21265 [Anaerolineae bacterium]|nr:hypothetical protein [Anaerolineae bacterium]
MTDETIEYVKRGIRESGEYRQKHGNLVIHKASYGANQTWKDVADIIRSNIWDEGISLLVLNDTFNGDPFPGIKKSLKVTYSYKGGEFQDKEVAEGEILQLP